MCRKAAHLEGPPNRTERVKFVRRVIGSPGSVAERMVLVMKAHRELDIQCRNQAKAAGLEVEGLTVADIAYPLVTKRLTGVFQQQLVHVQNGCVSDDPKHLPYVKVGSQLPALAFILFYTVLLFLLKVGTLKVGTINFHSTGHQLQSLCGTSKVEAGPQLLQPAWDWE